MAMFEIYAQKRGFTEVFVAAAISKKGFYKNIGYREVLVNIDGKMIKYCKDKRKKLLAHFLACSLMYKPLKY
jgi:hypothetical protein